MGKCVITFEDNAEGSGFTMKAEFDPSLTMENGAPANPTPAQVVGAELLQVVTQNFKAEAEVQPD